MVKLVRSAPEIGYADLDSSSEVSYLCSSVQGPRVEL